jgi:hypothetical protein
MDHSRTEVTTKRVNSGHMSNMSKSLIIITILLLLKITINEMSLIMLKRTIRASFNLIDQLTSDRTNTWGIGYKISRVSPLMSSNLLDYRMLLFWMKNGIAVYTYIERKEYTKNHLKKYINKKRLIYISNRHIGRVCMTPRPGQTHAATYLFGWLGRTLGLAKVMQKAVRNLARWASLLSQAGHRERDVITILFYIISFN